LDSTALGFVLFIKPLLCVALMVKVWFVLIEKEAEDLSQLAPTYQRNAH